MKVSVKKILKRIAALSIATAMGAGLLAGCAGKGNKEDGIVLKYVIQASVGANYETIVNKVNEILMEKTGCKVEFEVVSSENYDLVLSSGENIDLIFAPDYLNYWQNAEKGAFAEITDEDLKQYAPYFWENGGMALDVTKYKGVRYATAAISYSSADRCVVGRGDLMDKYGIKDLNSLENIEKYLTAVAENEKGIIPFNERGTIPWQMFALFASDAKWAPIGSVSYGGHIYFNIDDPEHKLFIAAEQPELLEFTKMMKRWNDKGFFSKSVMSNKTASMEAFMAGTSAFAFVDDPAACQKIWDEFQQDDRKDWDVRFYPRYHKSQLVDNLTNTMVAISATSKHKKEALKVIDEIYKNQELYRLLSYGIEGTDYVIDEEGYLNQLTDDDSRSWFGFGVRNDTHRLDERIDFPGYKELRAHLDEIRDEVAAVNMPIDLTNVKSSSVSLSEVYNQYSAPRCYGAFTGTAEDVLKQEVSKLKAAGIDEYLIEMQKQVDEYYKGIEK